MSTGNSNNNMLIHQLLNNNYVAESGYSYSDLLFFLNKFQAYYKDCYINNQNLEKDLIYKNKLNNELEKRIDILEKELENFRKENIYYCTKINKKLSLWERLTGKIK